LQCGPLALIGVREDAGPSPERLSGRRETGEPEGLQEECPSVL